jgi:AcrR family transcriptional regulator
MARDAPPPPTGLARRGRRRSERESEQRMLTAAAAMVAETGLTVSLEHISFERVIRAADVSRSAAYRRWPHKDLFFTDLVIRLARDATPTVFADEVGLIRRLLVEHEGWLYAPQTRQHLVEELVRQLGTHDFEALLASPAWRTYVALHATCAGIADPALRDRVRAALAESEHAHTEAVAVAWQRLAELLGYRLRPGLGAATFHTLAVLLTATLRGMLVTAASSPELARPLRAAPFTGSDPADWSPPAIALGAIASVFLEPDPSITWDKPRTAAIHHALATWAPPGGEPDTNAAGLSETVRSCRDGRCAGHGHGDGP